MEQGYNILSKKLEEFIRRYYLNQVVRGVLLIVALLLSTYLLVATTAFYGDLSTAWRAVLFYGFLGVNGYVFLTLIVLPLLRRAGWLSRMSAREAAVLIGDFFPEVRDKLLNTIDLHQMEGDGGSQELLLASITQRTEQLRPVPFLQMIDLKKNRKYLKVVLPVAAVFLFVLFAAPNVLREGSERVLRYQQYYAPIAPFDFILLNVGLMVEQSNDLEIRLQTTGTELPADVFIDYEGYAYKMESVKTGQFQFRLKNLQKGGKIRFRANKFFSDWYDLKVVPKPVMDRFELELIYPKYLNKKSERLRNTGDLLVPEGTQVNWYFEGANIDWLEVRVDKDLEAVVERVRKGMFESSWKAKESVNYQLLLGNELNPKVDTVNHSIQVVKDAFPAILSSESADSLERRMRYFSGEIADDYGFSYLQFFYQRFTVDDKPVGDPKSERLPISNYTRQQFYHYFDLKTLGLTDGEYVTYYFEVADNDGVNGAKKARSNVFTFRSLTEEESKQVLNTNAGDVQKQLEEAIKEAQKFQTEIDQLKKKLRDDQALSWEDKKRIKDLFEQQKKIQSNLEDASQKMEENKSIREERNTTQDELLKKQEKLQDLAERLLTDEMKKMMDELQRMMEEKSKDQDLQQKLEQLDISQQDVEKELDRMLEFFKQMEVEQKALEAIDKLDELSKKQDDLQQRTESGKTDEESLQQEQEALNEDFKALQEELKALEEKNEELERPNDLGDLSEEAKKIEEEMKDAEESLGQKNKKKAGKKQQSASEQMKEMSKKMKDQMQQQEMEMLEENIQSLRMLLENLLKFSFNQESLINRLQENSNYSPVYVEIGQDQFKLKDEAKLIEDSLVALSKRILQLESTVIKEVSAMNSNLAASIMHLGNRQTPQAKEKQQYTMTAVNNLAVLLSELLKNLQEEMAQKMQGEQQCQKPGGGSQSKMSKLSQMQKQLNEQMKQMQDGMKGKGKPGEKPGGQQGQGKENSQGFAEMVAKQEAIRRELQKLNQELNKDGQPGLGDLEQLAKEMEKTERELVNKQLTNQSINRQQEILTRLLEAEKAEREREFDERREATRAEEKAPRTPPGFEAYKKQKAKTLELYRTVSPELNAFYKQKVDQYFLQLSR